MFEGEGVMLSKLAPMTMKLIPAQMPRHLVPTVIELHFILELHNVDGRKSEVLLSSAIGFV